MTGAHGGKKIKGRKRHLIVDIEGLLMDAAVHSAGVSDKAGLRQMLTPELAERFPRMEKLLVDMGYESAALVAWVIATVGWVLEGVKHPWQDQAAGWSTDGSTPPPKPSGFHVLPKRWIVERTIAWLNRFRRLSKDYEYYLDTSEAFLYFISSTLILRRLARLRAQKG